MACGSIGGHSSMKRAVLYVLLSQSLVVLCATSNNGIITMTIKERLQTNITHGHTYNFSINATSVYETYSSFVFQIHADKTNVTLTNSSVFCKVQRECVTEGRHIGLVQLLYYPVVQTINFTVGYFCAENATTADCPELQDILVAVVGIEVYDPIPGGCSLTSALEIEAGMHVSRDAASKSVSFQNADIGFNPLYSTQPACSKLSSHYITRLKYSIYQTCLTTPTTSSIFSALESMMTPQDISKSNLVSSQSISYSQAKTALYYMLRGRGMVINVVATDTLTDAVSAYIPTMTYNCDQFSGECEDSSFSKIVFVIGPLIGIAGLFLCFLGHTFIHAEAIVFISLIASYLMYFILSSLTDLQDTDLAIVTATCALFLTSLMFILWFLTNWYYIFLVLYGASMGYVLTASLLFSPLGNYSVIHVSYVYSLILVCGMFLFMVPLIAFPSALNIVASSLVGSYAVAFGAGLFLNSFVTDILLRVVYNASISGYLNFNNYCHLSTIEIIHVSSWGLLFLVSLVIQSAIELYRRRSFKRKQSLQRQSFISNLYEDPVKMPYKSFPSISLFIRLRRFVTKQPTAPIVVRNNERRPLLSPNTTTNRYNV